MTTTKVKSNRFLNGVLWSVALLMFIAGIVANYRYQMVNVSLRIIAWIILVIITLAISLLTSQGRRALKFINVSRGELRKVFWPMRQEVMQMTTIVIGLVILLSLIIWGLDSFLLWAIGMLTGQRG